MASRFLLIVLGCLLPATALGKPVLPKATSPGSSLPHWSEHPGPAVSSRLSATAASSETTWFGGTVWAPDSLRWEAIPGGVWTFDSGVGSHFDHSAPHVNPFKDPSLHASMEGWIGIDFGFSDLPWFRRLTTAEFTGTPCVGTAAGLGGAASLWAGVLTGEADSLCYAAGRGYGDSWNLCVEQAFAYNGSGNVSWSFDYVNETEPGFDYSYALVDTTGSDDDVEVWSANGSVSGSANLTLTPGTTLRSDAGTITLKYCVISDGAYSDQDGFYPTDCGALAVDDVVVSGGGIAHSADFESGDDGWSLGPAPPGPGGDWSELRDVSTLPAIGAPCPTYCNVADSVLVFVDTTVGAGHNQFQDNIAASPWIDLRAAGMVGSPGHLLHFDGYLDLHVLNYVYEQFTVQYYPETCPGGRLTTSDWKPFRFGFVAYRPPINLCGSIISTSNSIPPEAEQVRIGLGLVSFCRFFINCTGITNTTPWYDNVRFGVFGTPEAPLIAAFSLELPQDSFPTDGTLNPTSTGRVDCNNVKGFAAPEPFSSLGDTLTVSGAYGGAEVRVQFAVDPGPGINVGQLNSWLGSHQPEGTWRGLSWYSARMDTAEQGGALIGGNWMTTYHEEDPNFIGSDTDTDPNDLDILGGQTRLANDIFPDDLLTPGSRLCLFYTTRFTSGSSWYCFPDTAGGGYLEMEVLPSSMGADSSFNCVLYVDHYDGFGAQPFIEGALGTLLPSGSGNFENTAWDRWDVRASNSEQGSFGRPLNTEYGATVAQTLGYETIIWNSGNLSWGTVSEDDANVLIPWLDWGQGVRNLYLSGDGIANDLSSNPPFHPRGLELLNRYLGVSFTCGSVRDADCPLGFPADTTACLDLDPVGGAYVAGTRATQHLAQGNGCPDQRFYDVLGIHGGSNGVPLGDETYQGPVKGTVPYASIANSGIGYRSVLDGVSLHYRRDPSNCLFDAPGATGPITERLAEVLNWFGTSSVCNLSTTPVDVDPTLNSFPARFALIIRSANPVLNSTQARFQIDVPSDQEVRVQVFDVRGRLVRTVVDEAFRAGAHDVHWDLRDTTNKPVSGGVYFVRAAGLETATQRMVVLH